MALTIDRLLGEPKKYHPLVGFGYIASKLEIIFNCASKPPAKATLVGGVCSVLLVMIPTLTYIFFIDLITAFPILVSISEIAVLYLVIGNQSLKEHVSEVQCALQSNDLSSAREKLGLIVSRNTDDMDENQLVSGTIETNLENGSDAVFAPMFWFFCLGAAGALAYRLCNTLDAMWGYRSERFEYFGKVAALVDDALNFLPARLVAISYALLGNTKQAFFCWATQARSLASPNAGPVMTAGAGALDIRLGGPTKYHQVMLEKPYFGGTNAATLKDIQRSTNLLNKTVVAVCVLALLVSLYGVTSQL